MQELTYPLASECSICNRETTVTRSEARDLYPNPDSLNAVDVVLEQRGWMKSKFDQSIYCPDCIGVAA